jgi:catechol 2,3-dioxygenase-like lactoylglutathione lyase family enzyme
MPKNMTPWAFVLAVPDMQKTAAYFHDVLGFRVLWDEASDWRLVERDAVRIMLGHCPNDVRPADIGSHNWFGYVNVDDVDALHAELAARGADCKPPFDQHYGMRELVVTTIDGHRIVFGEQRQRADDCARMS